MAKVKIVHPVVGESEVNESSVKVWLRNGWTVKKERPAKKKTVKESDQGTQSSPSATHEA